MATTRDLRVESLARHAELLEQVGRLRWKESAYGAQDPAPFIEITARETGLRGQLPMILVAIDAAGVVALGPIDDELSATERGDRTPWILGMVVRAESRKLGIGRQLLESLQHVAASLGHPRTWVTDDRSEPGRTAGSVARGS
jgi:GNAT superfamily N-acetyltransferase